jgi:hypothetical protein
MSKVYLQKKEVDFKAVSPCFSRLEIFATSEKLISDSVIEKQKRSKFEYVRHVDELKLLLENLGERSKS